MDVALRTRAVQTVSIHATQVAFALVVLIAVCAFAPRLLINDHVPSDVTPRQVGALKGWAAASSHFSGMFDLQVIRARRLGPHPPDVEGTITWRSLFGVPVGTTTEADGQSMTAVAYGKTFALWGTFLAVEGSLVGFIVQRTWNSR
jgi:hypothetical protein